jgi:class 3 adenylate cyclase
MAGDGALTTFDGSAGLHTGEIELLEAGIGGLAVHIGARVAALADGNEVLVSAAVPPLVAGSGIRFSPRGTHALKGVPDEWAVYRVEGDA